MDFIERLSRLRPDGQAVRVHHADRKGVECAMERFGRRLRNECVLTVISAVLCVLTLVFPQWVEELTGLEPDAGSGALEWIIVGTFFAAALVSAVVARRDYRRLAARRS